MDAMKENRNFHEEDVLKILSLVPYVRLIHVNGTKRFIEELVQNGEELCEVLHQYPSVLYEPLDDFYSLLRCLGNVSEEFIFDLCGYYHGKGVVTAAWLTLIAPNPAFKPYLKEGKNKIEKDMKAGSIIDLAIAEINGVTWQYFPEIEISLFKLRQLLSGVAIPAPTLRKAFTNEELYSFISNNHEIRRIYKEQGTQAALNALNSKK